MQRVKTHCLFIISFLTLSLLKLVPQVPIALVTMPGNSLPCPSQWISKKKKKLDQPLGLDLGIFKCPKRKKSMINLRISSPCFLSLQGLGTSNGDLCAWSKILQTVVCLLFVFILDSVNRFLAEEHVWYKLIIDRQRKHEDDFGLQVLLCCNKENFIDI